MTATPHTTYGYTTIKGRRRRLRITSIPRDPIDLDELADLLLDLVKERHQRVSLAM